uniref:Transmembrane protein n=1 Tax=Arundo donax TaxID=35708 RepID=A0A0A9E0U3_ARUDO
MEHHVTSSRKKDFCNLGIRRIRIPNIGEGNESGPNMNRKGLVAFMFLFSYLAKIILIHYSYLWQFIIEFLVWYLRIRCCASFFIVILSSQFRCFLFIISICTTFSLLTTPSKQI